MSGNNILLAAVIGGAVLLVMSKQARAAQTGVVYKPVTGNPAQISTSVPSDMWTRLMGSAWTSLVGGGNAKTTDGKPISANDPLGIYGGITDIDSYNPNTDSTPSLSLPDTNYNDGQLSWGEIEGLV